MPITDNIQQKQNISCNETMIVQQCIQGDVIAQKKLYDKFARKMFGTCLRYANNKEDAQDILQEGFVKVFRNLDTFKGTGSLEGWIRKIMIHTAIEHYRKSKSMFLVNIEEYDFKIENDERIDDSLQVGDLLKMIQELPVGYRVVFNLFAIEGYSHKEIGEQLNISEGTSKSQYARARILLQKKLKILS